MRAFIIVWLAIVAIGTAFVVAGYHVEYRERSSVPVPTAVLDHEHCDHADIWRHGNPWDERPIKCVTHVDGFCCICGRTYCKDIKHRDCDERGDKPHGSHLLPDGGFRQ